jgi:6-phosphogluconate dehydrogenase
MPLDAVARTWRAGCIIRSAMLDDMASALAASDPDRPLAFAPGFAERLSQHLPALRRVIAAATLAGLPVPALSAALQHFDQLRQARGTANMIQGLAGPLRGPRLRTYRSARGNRAARAVGFG